jgi:hypothetical protein
VVQDFDFGCLRDPHELRKFAMAITTETLGDIPWSGSNRIAQLIREAVVPSEIWRQQEEIDPQFELMSESPCGDFSKIPEASHARRGCKRVAVIASSDSGGFLSLLRNDNEET